MVFTTQQWFYMLLQVFTLLWTSALFNVCLFPHLENLPCASQWSLYSIFFATWVRPHTNKRLWDPATSQILFSIAKVLLPDNSLHMEIRKKKPKKTTTKFTIIATKTFKMHLEKKQCKKNLCQRKLLAQLMEVLKTFTCAFKRTPALTFSKKNEIQIVFFSFTDCPFLE